MRSAIVLTPQGTEEWACTQTWMFLLAEARLLSITLNQDVEILLQHNLKLDNMCVMAEVGATTFSGIDIDFNKALTTAAVAMRKYRKEHEKLLATKKQAAGEEGGKGRRGEGTEGKRLKRLRKG